MPQGTQTAVYRFNPITQVWECLFTIRRSSVRPVAPNFSGALPPTLH